MLEVQGEQKKDLKPETPTGLGFRAPLISAPEFCRGTQTAPIFCWVGGRATNMIPLYTQDLT